MTPAEREQAKAAKATAQKFAPDDPAGAAVLPLGRVQLILNCFASFRP